LKLLEILVGLEVRIGLRECEHLAERAGQHVLRCRLLGRALGSDRGVPRLHHRLQRAALVGGVSLYRLDQVGDQVVAQLELHIDVGERLADPLPHGDELVVDHDDPQDEDDNHSENDPAGRGHEGLLAGVGNEWRRNAGGHDLLLLGRCHDDVGSEFRQKKTPGFRPGVTSSNGGSGGKGGCRPTITQSCRSNAFDAGWFLAFEEKSENSYPQVHRPGDLPSSRLRYVTSRQY